jgi:subtilisin family serine protease
MMKCAWTILPVALVSMAGRAASAAEGVAVPQQAPATIFAEQPGVLEFTGQMIVRPIQGLVADSDARARALLAPIALRYHAAVDEYIVSVPVNRSNGAPGSGENALAAELMATGFFQYVVPNWMCFPLEVTPNDPLFSSQWHHPMMRSSAGWSISTGSPDLTVAVTDTGIDLTHPDLTAHRVMGYDAYNNVREVDGGSVADINGHGTHVAGCAAAIGNNAAGVAGPNWNSKIMMIRVAIDGGGGAYYEDLMEGARWAIENGAKTVSASYSGVGYEPLQTTAAYIKSIGGLYFYAAGNDNRNLTGFDWPDLTVVGASESSDNKAGFSAYGRGVDVFAPGQDILSSTNGGGYGYASGTSMATPVANGVASLVWSINPALTPDQVQNILYISCRDLGVPGDDDYYGWGRVDVLGVTTAAAGTLGPADPTATDDGFIAIGDAVAPAGELLDAMGNDFDVNGDTISLLSFSAVSANGATLSRSVGSGPGGRDQILYTAPAGFSGNDTFVYTIQDSTGRNDSATATVNVMDGSLFRTPENPAHEAADLDVAYYVTVGYSNLPNFDALTPYARTRLPDINFPSTNGAYSTSGRAEEVGATYTGFVTVPRAGIYTFYTSSDDGSRLFIGDQVVLNNDGLHGMVEVGGQIALKAGTHAFKVIFFENFGGAGLIASIQGPGLNKQPIAASMFSREVCAADFNGDGFVDFFDYDSYVSCFEGDGCPARQSADFNGDGFADFFDYDSYIAAFESGC